MRISWLAERADAADHGQHHGRGRQRLADAGAEHSHSALTAMTGSHLATRPERLTVYAVGLAQGIALVNFPAASTIFIEAGSYHLSGTRAAPPDPEASAAASRG
jgi:hypothetical protein